MHTDTPLSDPRASRPTCPCTAADLNTPHDFAACPQAVAPYRGDWVIRMGHPGYNSPANNGFGYASEQAARAAVRRYQRPVTKLTTPYWD